jgi:flagellar export protein FliJ
MAFQFSLESLLRFRRSLEHQKELSVIEVNQAMASVRQQIKSLNLGLAQSDAAEEQSLGRGLSASEIHFHLLCRSALLQSRSLLEERMATLERRRSDLVQQLREARRQREAVESLRSQRFTAYRQDEVRREQRRMDDLFLLRRGFRQ